MMIAVMTSGAGLSTTPFSDPRQILYCRSKAAKPGRPSWHRYAVDHKLKKKGCRETGWNNTNSIVAQRKLKRTRIEIAMASRLIAAEMCLDPTTIAAPSWIGMIRWQCFTHSVSFLQHFPVRSCLNE